MNTPRTDEADKECITDADFVAFAKQLETKLEKARETLRKLRDPLCLMSHGEKCELINKTLEATK